GSNSGGGGSNSGGGVSPVPGAVIGAHFGQYGVWSRYHTGLDFRAAYGTPIRAVKSGVVLFAGNKGDWAGNHVAVRHGDGRTTMSSHMSSMAVGSGQVVQAGQVIGYVGQTGRAFGAHLHFELYPAGVRFGDVYNAIDPQPWLEANGIQTH
ncbi:MAG TPA: M23 family metallopeptidase, partial [Propionibacteriaceae bacterium]|nr:M23 family metallopeptidase [Propionibacteriaceae bacterium]